MDKHGSESYFVINEGLLGETLGGRDSADRRLFLVARADEVTPPFRFSRMGPSGVDKQLGEPNLKKIGGGDGRRRRGLVADPSRVHVPRTVRGPRPSPSTRRTSCSATTSRQRSSSPPAPRAWTSTRCTAGGPNDPESEKFYEADKIHLKMGTAMAAGGGPSQARPRPPARRRRHGEPAAEGNHPGSAKRREPRGRPGCILAMIRFHNRVVDTLPAAIPPGAALRQGAPEGRQALPVDAEDGLPPAHLRARRRRATSSTKAGRRSRSASPRCRLPTMPIEFSVAAFRLGHSMIRAIYNWNRGLRQRRRAPSTWLFHLFGRGAVTWVETPRLASNWIADFRRLFDFSRDSKPTSSCPPPSSTVPMRIDTTLVNPLGAPSQAYIEPTPTSQCRNLRRARDAETRDRPADGQAPSRTRA